jgi:hypothetical protein
MQIGPADSAGGDADQHLIVLRHWIRRIGEFEWIGLNLRGGIEQTGLHGTLLGESYSKLRFVASLA